MKRSLPRALPKSLLCFQFLFPKTGPHHCTCRTQCLRRCWSHFSTHLDEPCTPAPGPTAFPKWKDLGSQFCLDLLVRAVLGVKSIGFGAGQPFHLRLP